MLHSTVGGSQEQLPQGTSGSRQFSCHKVTMEIYVAYTKKWHEFGHHCQFSDMPASVVESVQST